jgi:hypothetical protein
MVKKFLIIITERSIETNNPLPDLGEGKGGEIVPDDF